MITRFKIFENQEEYKVGDWVFLMDRSYLDISLRPFVNETPCQITKISIPAFSKPKYKRYEFRFLESPKRSDHGFKLVDLGVSFINRKATPEEIENYMISLDAKKYNL